MDEQIEQDAPQLRELAPGEAWFAFREISPGIIKITEPYVHKFMQSNMWLIRASERDMLIDTGNGVASLRLALSGLKPRHLVTVATHAHADHVGSIHEFDQVLAHGSIVEALQSADPDATLAESGYALASMAGLKLGPPRISDPLVSAKPSGFDPALFGPKPARIARGLEEGDIVDLGDHIFSVLHLPGHSPACIGLYETRRKLLIAGDAIYDGPLVDDLHHSDRSAYRDSLARLLELDVELVLAGHAAPFSGERLKKLIAQYLAGH